MKAIKRIVLDHLVNNEDTDLWTMAAIVYEDDSVTVWPEMNRDEARMIFDRAFEMLTKYTTTQVGSGFGAGLLGTLEDLFPDWVAEFFVAA